MKTLILSTLLLAFAGSANAICSSLIVTYTNDDGSALGSGPLNTLTDATCGLTEEQATKHHYILKAAVGAGYIKAAEEGADTYVNATAGGRRK